MNNKDYEDYKDACDKIRKIYSDPNTFFIHYSCTSFFGGEAIPKITSISIFSRRLNRVVTFDYITSRNYLESKKQATDDDNIERRLLEEYTNYLNDHQSCKWIHWNMSSTRFGFEALNLRCEALGVQPLNLDSYDLQDLSGLFTQKYGRKFIEGPRMTNLAVKNNLWKDYMYYGSEEPELFAAKEYKKLQISSSEKAKLIFSFLNLSVNNKLKTNTRWIKDIYGISIQGLWDYFRSVWWGQLIIFLIGTLVGAWVNSRFF